LSSEVLRCVESCRAATSMDDGIVTARFAILFPISVGFPLVPAPSFQEFHLLKSKQDARPASPRQT
jgi:hypothetical protein